MPEPTPTPPSHYFDGKPVAPSAESTFVVRGPIRHLTLTSDRATFSHGSLDRGTKILLENIGDTTVLPDGDLLDLGCGVGPIALTLALRNPNRTIWAIDVNERALALCERNARDNSLDNVRVCHVDQLTLRSGPAQFAAIWSNPPIHVGKPELHSMLLRWLVCLAPGGYSRLVVNKNLGSDSLQKWLEDEHYPTQRVLSRSGFRILQVSPRTI